MGYVKSSVKSVTSFGLFTFLLEDEDFGYRLERTPLAEGDPNVLARAEGARERLLEAIANSDDDFMDLFYFFR